MRKETIEKLLEMFLDDYADTLSNQGCTDTPNSWLDLISEEEEKEFSLIYHNYNNSPMDEHHDSIIGDDWLLVRAVKEFLFPSE